MPDLHRTILLGLQRVDWPQEAGQSAEAHLLGALARQAVAGKAGWEPSPLTAEERPLSVVEEEQPWVDLEAARSLEALLSGKRPLLLVEWLALAQRYAQLVRPVHLPRLLNLALQQPLPEALLLTAIGERGRWLATQHPQWQALLPPVEADWKLGQTRQRQRYLRRLRQQDPGAALAQLEPLLKKRAYAQLERLLPELEVGLSENDLPWLEPLAAVKASGLRSTVFRLLGALPNSSLGQAARPLARQSLRREGDDLVISLPRADDLPWLKGYQPLTPDSGRKHSWAPGGHSQLLVKLLATVPLVEWPTHLAFSPEQLIRKLPDHIWGEALYQSWTLAAWQQQDPTWATQLLRLVLYPKHDPAMRGEVGYQRWLPEGWRVALLTLVPAEDRNRLLRASMPYVDLHAAYPLPFALLKEVPAPVEVATARAFAQRLIALLQVNERQLTRELRQLVQQLPAIAHRLPVEVYQELLSTWASNPSYSLWYDPYLQEALQVLAFRRRMALAFA